MGTGRHLVGGCRTHKHVAGSVCVCVAVIKRDAVGKLASVACGQVRTQVPCFKAGTHLVEIVVLWYIYKTSNSPPAINHLAVVVFLFLVVKSSPDKDLRCCVSRCDGVYVCVLCIVVCSLHSQALFFLVNHIVYTIFSYYAYLYISV